MKLSVIIPTYNEELSITKTLDVLSRLVNVDEIIVVDGGSTDRTVEIVEDYKEIKKLELVKLDSPNRGRQLNEGAKAAEGEILWFIHADTRPIQGSGRQIKRFLNHAEIIGGNFEIIFGGGSRWAKFLTWLYPNLRVLGLAYGDSAFFVRRETFDKIGGFREYPLFEDVDLYKRIRTKGRFVQIRMPVTASSRRFENRNFLWVFLKWTIRQLLYWVGFPPRLLGKTYKQIR
ncbi:MAG: TIGR04283 family arsenosugar biosynthesis glycosyltransferase [Pyrinomonadaceae bacterium]